VRRSHRAGVVANAEFGIAASRTPASNKRVLERERGEGMQSSLVGRWHQRPSPATHSLKRFRTLWIAPVSRRNEYVLGEDLDTERWPPSDTQGEDISFPAA
jgi:hypothetical protein